MRLHICLFPLILGLPLIAGAGDAPKAAPKSDKDLIANALSAGPKSIRKGAAVVTMGADGKMSTLREGKNGWTCMPDEPGSPGNDPMCMDANAFQWAHAYMSHQPPPDKVGFIFMLQGGSDASNIDPYAPPPKDGKWLTTGPHVMVVGPAVKDMPGYPRVADPDPTKPYVMFPGTPYEHLMIPVN